MTRSGFLSAYAILSLCLLWTAVAQEPPKGAESLSQRGRSALEAGRYKEAEASYAELVKREPDVAELRVTLGMVYFKEGKFDASVGELRHALSLRPGMTRVDTLLAMALSEKGQYKEALPALEKGFRQTTDGELRRMCGLRLERAYTALHSDTKAVTTATELRAAYPEDPEVLYYSSKIFGNAAFLTAQKLFQAAPESTWALMAAGEAQEAQGDTDAAVGDYKAVLQKDPERQNVHYRIGRTLLARAEGKSDADDLKRAAEEFRQELALDEANANAAYELAEIERRQGNVAEALRYFEQAVESYPMFEEAHVGLAAVLSTQGDVSGALPHLERAVTLNPEDQVAWYRLAQVDRKLGRAEEQRKALAEFARLRAQRHGVVPATNAEVTPQRLDLAESQQ
ncbi:MAG: tetratricopeptide repeat protein [Acidobacteriaceae bacterium]|nr:tetratricopeptide repeat protein [Acidobacteriaceae bacterium]